MNILFLSTTFPDAAHPARGTYNWELCKSLAVNHHVKVISPRPWTDTVKRLLRQESIKPSELASAVNLECHYPTFIYPPGILRPRYGQFMSASIRSTVSRICRSWVPDLVLSYWVHPEGEAGVRVASRFNAQSAVIVGGSDVLLLPKRKGCKQFVVDTLQKSTKVITVSDGLNGTVREFGVPPENAHTIYQGIDVSKFHPGNQIAARNDLGLDLDRPTLLWVGRMEPVKSLDVLLDAVRTLRNSIPDIQLCLVGHGSETQRVQQRVTDLQLNQNVRFAGAIGHDALPDWYRAADITVLTSHSEGLPNVLRESLACGTPFVSTNVGSIHEIAEPGMCELTPTGDPDTFATAVQDVLKGCHRENTQQYQPRQWQQTADEIVAAVESKTASKTSSKAQTAHGNGKAAPPSTVRAHSPSV